MVRLRDFKVIVPKQEKESCEKILSQSEIAQKHDIILDQSERTLNLLAMVLSKRVAALPNLLFRAIKNPKKQNRNLFFISKDLLSKKVLHSYVCS